MGTPNPSLERPPSESRIPQASTKRMGLRDEERHPMFDTLAVTRELQESGLGGAQAEAIVAAFGAIAGNMATKDDLKNFATKDDLRAIEERMEKMATKDDLRAIEERMEKMATKDDLKNYVTEASLLKATGELRQEMQAGIVQMQNFFIKAALGTVTVNLAMVGVIFVAAKHLM